MSRLRVLIGLLAIPIVTAWNLFVTFRSPVPAAGPESRLESSRESSAASSLESDRETGQRTGVQTVAPAVVEYERGWLDYLRGFDAHHGPDGSPDARPAEGSLVRGLRLWVDSDFLRGYTLGNDVYVLRDAPAIVRIHQAGHTPWFGAAFEPLADDYREDGGLPDEPLRTLDVMLPGEFPHTLLRLRDSRGLRGAYAAWLYDGRIERVRE